MKRRNSNQTTQRFFPKKMIKPNKTALKSFEAYLKAKEIIEMVNLASGKKGSYRLTTESTIKSKIDTNGISSTQQI